jgi:hypothetical protein
MGLSRSAMRYSRWIVAALLVFIGQSALAQDLAPRAYVITPVHWNAVNMTYSYYNGNLDFDGSVPITDAAATANMGIVSLFHAIKFFGRSANFLVALPYAVANFHGTALGSETNVYRSGLWDSAWRFSVNLKGGPAMEPREFAKWKQKTIIGASFKVVAPTGQYDSTKLINNGNNRWAFKPEVGVSQRWGHWMVDGYTGVWFYTTNPKYFSQNQYNPGITTRSQAPIGSFEGHLSYDVRQRLWASLDGNYWFGGTVSLNGVPNPVTRESSSRLGGTLSVPFTKHSSLKFSYSDGAYVKYGGNFQNVSVSWQYSWFGRPR